MNRRKLKTLSEEKQKSVRNAFILFDTDKDEHLDRHELKAAIRALGIPIKKSEVLKIMESYDKSSCNSIGYDDFYCIVSDKILRCDPLDEIKYAFQLFVDGKAKAIDYHDLKQIAEVIEADVSEDDLRGMINEFDFEGKGKIDEEDFIKIMTNNI